VFAFVVEGTTNRSECLGQGENLPRDKQIGILCSDWMPVHTLSCDGNFRHKIGSAKGDSFGGGTAQSDPAYDSVLRSNLLLIEELTELLSLGIGGNGGRQAHAKPLRTSALNSFTCPRPRATPAMEVMQFRCSAVQADLQDNSIAGQRCQAFHASSGK
jgi:hypothetical protein